MIELNEEFRRALDLIEKTVSNVFVTGKAGTGKSTLLEYFRNNTQKNVVVLAPTGVAALNVNGETIHSFFRFKPNITEPKVKKIKDKKNNIYKKVDAIIIDEISMVRADLLDCIDKFLRLNGKNSKLAFGGAQMVFIGDLYQLPPVVPYKEKELFCEYYKSPYFFDAKAFEGFPMEFIELQKVYRQKDEQFINLLNTIRNNSIDEEGLGLLNQRHGAEFKNKGGSCHIYLTTTNDMASQINDEYLAKLKSRLYTFEAAMEGEFDKKYMPTEYALRLKPGAQVMLLNNDSYGRWVNGSIGKVLDIRRNKDKEEDFVRVELSDGNVEDVYPYKWEIFHFRFNDETNHVEAEGVGYFIQFPLKLSWAVTIHKSQGKTFDRVIIDIGRGTFAHGQMYVALSRCRSMEGIILKRPIEKKHILMDRRVVQFVTKYQYQLSERDMPLEDKSVMIKDAIDKGVLLEIIYLKASDVRSKRVVKPISIGQREYMNKQFLGMDAFCLKRKEERVFRVDRILEMKQKVGAGSATLFDMPIMVELRRNF